MSSRSPRRRPVCAANATTIDVVNCLCAHEQSWISLISTKHLGNRSNQKRSFAMTIKHSNTGFEYLKDLNRQQRRAVKHGLKDGPVPEMQSLLVIAGAGSGKTKVGLHPVSLTPA